MQPITKLILLVLIISPFVCSHRTIAQTPTQTTGSIRGRVTDPSGAIVRNAAILVMEPQTQQNTSATSNALGTYQITGLAPGAYNVTVDVTGFRFFTAFAVHVQPNQTTEVDAHLVIDANQDEVQVNTQSIPMDASPDSNASAVVLEGKDLHALSDDPEELASQLQALAGPSAGPNGAEVYIDGFTGGQIPPKSSILAIRINQNPFSAQYDRLGYGRIEILTRAGTSQLHGNFMFRGNHSALNSQNPILNSNRIHGSKPIIQPAYFSYYVDGTLGGPLTHTTSFFTDVFTRSIQNFKIIDAIDPATVTALTPNGVPVNQTIANPRNRTDATARIDLQLGAANTLSLKYSLYRSTKTNQGVGQTALASQAFSTNALDHNIQLSLSTVLSSNYINRLAIQFLHAHNDQIVLQQSPTVTVPGAFLSGGSNAGTTHDTQNDLEVDDYVLGTAGQHQLTAGGRLRLYRDSNYSDAGSNGNYIFSSLTAYLNRTPQQYRETVISNNQFTAQSSLYDAALFVQDDWKLTPDFTFSYGIRWESQNYINDKSDWAPRIYLAYILNHAHGRPKTILRTGYGWFYQRFTVPNTFDSLGGTPYVAQAIHYSQHTDTTPANQQIYIVNNPTYAETSPGNATKPTPPSSANAATVNYTIAPNFHSALDIQGAIGVDRSLSKKVTANITYLYSRGLHQYMSNNISAPEFNSALDTYPDTALTPPNANIYQFQSSGIYHQNQWIATVNARFHKLQIVTYYSYNLAKGDTNGVNYFPSNAHNPTFDYGRTSFDIRHRFLLSGNLQLPFAFAISPFLAFNSGTPYNITIGNDLTANNQFNARPAFANPSNGCVPPLVPYGQLCLDPNPTGTHEQIIPYGLGTGPANVTVNLRLSKAFGFGPRLTSTSSTSSAQTSTQDSGAEAITGSAPTAGHNAASTDRRYSFTVSIYTVNLFNHQNLSPPNGTILSPFFGKSQSLATGPFSTATAGNRSVFFQGAFSF